MVPGRRGAQIQEHKFSKAKTFSPHKALFAVVLV